MAIDSESHANPLELGRHERVQKLVDQYIERRSAGQPIADSDFITAHADLMPQLGEALQRLALLARAERQADDPSSADDQENIRVVCSSATTPPHGFPGYEVLRELRRGGQGIVYQAVQTSTKRKVAVKVLLEGAYASPGAKRRFEREIELVARLKHPHIINIFHSGTSQDGRQFYVMDYVRGLPLNLYVHNRKLSLEEALKLFGMVCEAVQYAHQRGIIHRDLKPSNILVEPEGVPRILDFGLGKWMGGPVQTIVSISQELVGTLPYMSPEQARGNPDEIDTRTDIYALGVMLYELLTGHYPYPVVGQLADTLKHITQTPPTPPTKGWTSDSGVTQRTSRRLREGQCPIDDEVKTIVMKALSKERERRYQSAAELARDVRHYLAGEAIEAKRDSALYIIRKQISRYKAPIGVAAAIVVSLVVGLVGTMWQAHRVAEQRDAAVAARQAEEKERKKSEAINQFIQKALQSSDPHQGGKQEMLVADAMTKAVKQLDDGAFKDEPETDACLRLTIATILNGNGRSAEALPLAERALAIYQQLHPGDHADVAKGLSDVAVCRDSLGHSAEALPLAERALAIYQQLHPGDNADVAKGLNDVAVCLYSLGRSALALPKFEAALEMYQRLFKGDHTAVAKGLNNLADCLNTLGRSAEALPKFETALEIRQRLFKGDHPDVAISLNNVAACLNSLGQSAKALPQYEAALEMRQRLFKGDHPDVAASLNNVAGCLDSFGRSAEALPKFEAAHEMWQRVFKADHPAVAMGLNNVAFCLNALGRSAEALPKLEAALEMQQRLFKGDHPYVATNLNNVAFCLDSLGRTAEALPKFEAALEVRQRLFKGDHPDVANSLNNVARCLRSLGRSADALSKYEAALAMYQRLYKGDHPETARGLNNLAECLGSLGRSAEALPRCEAALAMRRRVLSAGHPDVQISLISLGRVLIDLHRFDEAEELLVKTQATIADRPDVSATWKQSNLKALVKLYESREAADSGKGYDQKAAQWGTKLAAWQATTQPAASQPSTTPPSTQPVAH